MKDIDQFGKDPSVIRTRKLFSIMEKLDSDLLEKAGLSLFDIRLRSVREIRLSLYERAFSSAMEKGMHMDESAAIDLFNICQKIALKTIGISFETERPENPELAALLKEILA